MGRLVRTAVIGVGEGKENDYQENYDRWQSKWPQGQDAQADD